MNALLALLHPFLKILTQESGPEDLPASRFLLWLVIVVHIVIYWAGMLALETGPRVIALPVIDTIAQSLFFVVLLSVMKLQARILQTLTAVFGTDIILNGLSLPLLMVSQSMPESPVALVTGFAAIVVLLWSLGVKGYILQRAAGFPYFVGVTLALAFFVALYSFDTMIFGAS